MHEAVESVLAQTVEPKEIVVVDDGSTDDTGEVVAAFGDRIRYIRQENQGVSAARNRGVAETTGDLIAFLDADDYWAPTKLEKQLAVFESDPEIGLVHCGMREFDSATGATLALHIDGAEGSVAENLLLWKAPVIIGPGCTIMVSRAAFEEAGGFDREIKCGEDWDLCYRIARQRAVGFVPEPLVNYRVNGLGAHYNIANMEKGMARFLEKAFAEDAGITKFKSRAYGNYHRVLAGSYFQAGQYGGFLRNAAKSIWRRPANLRYFLEFPRRRMRR